MQRISRWARTEGIYQVMRSLPKGILNRLGEVAMVVDSDPIAAGLEVGETASFGRSYRNTSHVLYPHGQLHLPASMRETTMILFDGDGNDPKVILHELGHVLDERLGFQRPDIIPMDSYAATHHLEAFATAFQSWATVQGPDLMFYHNRDKLLSIDPAAVHFFDELAR